MKRIKNIKALQDLTPDRANANRGTQRGRGMVEASLAETGAGRSIVADAAGEIIAGNKTLEAWAAMGGEILVVPTDGKKLVVVQRTDLDLADPQGQARKLAYYDNRAGQVGLDWDAEQITADIAAGVDLGQMFYDDELAALLASVDAAGSGTGAGGTPAPTLAERFGVPPFSVLDARQGYWQERKRQWLSIGIQSELGRGENVLDMSASMAGITDPAAIEAWNEQRRKRGAQ